jgi:hypothetical protein
MPGRRYGTFRTGDIAESLGLVLLKTIATVSEVPRQEDVGIDAVANLLRRDDDGNLYAEDEFTVQFKSNLDEIPLTSHAVDWFTNLATPYFIGRVNRPAVSLDIYSTHAGRNAVMAGHATEIRFRYEKETGHDAVLNAFGYSHYLEGDAAVVWLGEPLVRLQLSDDQTKLDGVYAAMRSFVHAEQLSIQFSRLGLATLLKWKSDIGITDIRLGFHGRRDGLSEVIGYAAPAMMALLTYGISITSAPGANRSLLESILSVARSLTNSEIGERVGEHFTYWEEAYKHLLLRRSKQDEGS